MGGRGVEKIVVNTPQTLPSTPPQKIIITYENCTPPLAITIFKIESPPLLEQCVAEHASAMGLKVKWLTNSQFELREES